MLFQCGGLAHALGEKLASSRPDACFVTPRHLVLELQKECFDAELGAPLLGAHELDGAREEKLERHAAPLGDLFGTPVAADPGQDFLRQDFVRCPGPVPVMSVVGA